MAAVGITIRRAEARDVAPLKKVLRETFEGTWLPHISAASAQRYVEKDIGGRYVLDHWREFAVAEIGGGACHHAVWQGGAKGKHVRSSGAKHRRKMADASGPVAVN